MSFPADYAFSRTPANVDHARSLLRVLLREPKAEVDQADPALDKSGVDYVVTLQDGAALLVDEKRRRAGCSRHWRHGGVELFLEIWSVKPDARHRGVVGWPLRADALTDYVLFTFDPSDTDRAYLVPFHLLRLALISHGRKWVKTYGAREQPQPGPNVPMTSMSVPVPWPAVRAAVGDAMCSWTAQQKEGA